MADINSPNFSEFASLVDQINAMANSAALPKAVNEMKKWNQAVESLASSELSKKLLRTHEQNLRARKLGEADLFNLQVNYQNRLLSLETRLDAARTSGNKRQVRQLQSEADVLRNQMEFTGTQLDYVKELIGENANLSDIDKDIIKNKIELAAVEQRMQVEKNVAIQMQLASQKEGLTLQQKMLDVAKQDELVQKRQAKLSAGVEKLFGINIETMKQEIEEIGTIAEGPLGIFFLMGFALKGAVGELNALRREAKTTFTQTIGLAKIGGGGLLQALSGGTIATLGQTSEAVGALVQSYGRLDFLSKDLVASQLQLTQVYGLQQEEAAHLVRELDFMGNRSDKFVKNTLDFARALAKANSIGVGQLMEDMAKNSELLARYGNEGAEAFVRAAASARKIGIELSDLDKFADTTLDIEGFLSSVQRVRTLGVNITNPTKLMQLANANDLEGLGRELQRQIGGVDFARLTRIQQHALEQALGLSAETIQRITHSARFGQTGALKAPTEEDRRGQLMDNLTATLGNLSSSLSGLTHVLGLLIGAFALKGLAGPAGAWLGSMLPGLGSIPLLGRFFKSSAVASAAGAAAEAPIAAAAPKLMGGFGLRGLGNLGGGIALGAGAFDIGKALLTGGNVGEALNRNKFLGLGALAGSIIPGVGTLLGAGVGGLADLIVNSLSSQSPTSSPNAQTPGQPIAVEVDTKGIEMRLDELITMFQNGSIAVNLDGRKIGKLLATTYPRTA